MQTDLQNAFASAPYFFRKQLCDLDGVFIGPPGASWGFRNATNKKRYIAIPADLWSAGTPARRLPLSYRAYETAVVNRLLNGWPGAHYPPGLGGPADSGLTTILGALAHEYGHILWYGTYVPNPRDPANFNNFCAGTFYAESWDTISDTPPPNRWLPWGYQSSSTHKQDDVQISDILTAPSGQTGARLARIFRVHGPTTPPYGRWANLFAAFSPEEDFVETFKLFVLQRANPPLTNLKIQIKVGAATISRDIPGTVASRPVLQRKLTCFAQAPFVTAP
jgi:hypothetical protein